MANAEIICYLLRFVSGEGCGSPKPMSKQTKFGFTTCENPRIKKRSWSWVSGWICFKDPLDHALPRLRSEYGKLELPKDSRGHFWHYKNRLKRYFSCPEQTHRISSQSIFGNSSIWVWVNQFDFVGHFSGEWDRWGSLEAGCRSGVHAGDAVDQFNGQGVGECDHRHQPRGKWKIEGSPGFEKR